MGTEQERRLLRKLASRGGKATTARMTKKQRSERARLGGLAKAAKIKKEER
jgi:hypothetical protein